MSNKKTDKADETKIAAALGKYFPGAATLTLNGTAIAATALVQMISDHVASIDAADAAHASYLALVRDERAKRAQLRALLKVLKSVVVAQFGPTSQAANDFGYTPQPHKPTVATKAQAVLKVRATRSARKTVGKRQRKAIKGAVPETPSGAPKGA